MTTTTTSVHPVPPQYMQSQQPDAAMDITHKIADLVVEKLRPELNQLILQQSENIKQTIIQTLLDSKKTNKNNGALTTQQRNKMRDSARELLDVTKRYNDQDMHRVQLLVSQMQSDWGDLEDHVIEKALKDFLENSVEYQKQKELKPDMLKRKAEKQKERRQSKKHNSNGSPGQSYSPTATTPTSQSQNTPTHSLPLSSMNSPVVLGTPIISLQHPGMQTISPIAMVGQSIHQHMTMQQPLQTQMSHLQQQGLPQNIASQMHNMNQPINNPTMMTMPPQAMNTEMEK
jgi:hypothetical protein